MTGSPKAAKPAKPADLPPAATLAPAGAAVPLQRTELGNGLELWRVPVGLPREQSVNARVMTPEAFKQLADNIRRDDRLESLPLCALLDGQLEIISGHHRIRAAKKAGLAEIWVLVDTTGLSRDKVRSKQLSHNSLQGLDDAEVVAQIFSAIADSEARISAFIQIDSLQPKTPLTLETNDLQVEFAGKTATILFLPAQLAVLVEALDMLKAAQVDEVFLVTLDEYDLLMTALDQASYAFGIRSTPTIFAKMAEIVLAHCNQLQSAGQPVESTAD